LVVVVDQVVDDDGRGMKGGEFAELLLVGGADPVNRLRAVRL